MALGPALSKTLASLAASRHLDSKEAGLLVGCCELLRVLLSSTVLQAGGWVPVGTHGRLGVSLLMRLNAAISLAAHLLVANLSLWGP